MPNTKAQDTVEFGWSGTDGYIRNGGKYNLLMSKPQLTFVYDSLMYSTDPAIEDIRTVGTQVFPLQPNEMSELHDYAVANSVTDPWNPVVPTTPVVQSIETIDIVKLAGANYVSNTAVLTQTLLQEHNSGNYAVKYRLVSYGTFTFPASSSNTKTTTLSLIGMFSNGQYVFCDEINLNGWTVSGGTNQSTHSYRVDQTKRQTNNISVVVNGSTNGAITVAAIIIIEFHLPNQDYGLGVPFPEFPTSQSTVHKVYNVTD